MLQQILSSQRAIQDDLQHIQAHQVSVDEHLHQEQQEHNTTSPAYLTAIADLDELKHTQQSEQSNQVLEARIDSLLTQFNWKITTTASIMTQRATPRTPCHHPTHLLGRDWEGWHLFNRYTNLHLKG